MAGPLLYDRIMDTTTTTGTGTLTLSGTPVVGYRGFSVVDNGNTCCFMIEAVDADGVATGDWELAVGTYTAVGVTLSRTQTIASSTGSAVSFAAGTKRVYLVQPSMSQYVDNVICCGRLTTETAVPVSTSNRTAQSIVYFTPFRGNRIALWDSNFWRILYFSELSIGLTGLTTGKNYDIFAYTNGTAALLDAPLVWTDDTTRATDLTLQDGVLVKTGDTRMRYLGTFRATASDQTEDSASRRFLWNYYHRMPRKLLAQPTDSSHNYTTDTWREWNATTTVGETRVELVTGVAEQPIELFTQHNVFNAAIPWCFSGIGVDSTTVNSADTCGGFYQQSGSAYRAIPTVGYHYYQLIQRSQASGTTTWYGANTISAGFVAKSGITGTVAG